MYEFMRLIDEVHSLSPARERWVGQPVESVPDRVTVTFATGRRGHLDLKDPLTAHRAAMIDELAQAGRPVYVEIDEETDVITDVLVPFVSTVERLDTDDHGNLLVRLTESHAIHGVVPSAAGFESMRDSLQAALADGSARLITRTDDDFEIIDVRDPPSNPGGGGGSLSPPAPDPPVTPQRAKEIFGDMNAETCSPCNPSTTCIPFLYPDDGCWIRAHLMAYAMRAYTPPEDPEKSFIQGSLHPFVPNHPDCKLPWGWGWHIAPNLTVTLNGGTEKRVIDPSLAPEPVTEAQWTALNNPSGASTLTTVPWTRYNPFDASSTATESQAHQAMQGYRNSLKTRCLTYGPPPYSCTKQLFFIVDRSTISDDEIEAMLLGGSPARISDAFYVVLDGFSPQELGFTSATMQHQPTISVSPSVSGMAVTAAQIAFEYPTHLNRRQRLTWTHHLDFTNITGFTASKRVITLQASMATQTGTGTLYLIKQPNPYEIDGPVSWLSTDLRVFQMKQGETRFGVTMGTDPNAFIIQVITKLNNNTAGQTFDSISTDQQTSRLELSQKAGGVNVYNFAVAKVRYRSTVTDAQDVRVFFKLFPWATTTVEYNQATEYRRYQSGNQVIPLLGRKNNAVTSIPCFAAARVDTSTVSMTSQVDAPNVQTIAKDTSGAEVAQYFGCWLDINQPHQKHFPFQLPSINKDGPYTSGRKSIQDHVRNEHQCLVSEIAFLPAPAQNGTTPAQSDKLAQRNLAIVEAANPGVDLSRRVAQTFEIQPSAGALDHDELLIDWGNVPVGSLATLHLPQIDSGEILALASRKYRHHRLRRIDRHTIKFETGGISYIPIPYTDGTFPGLLTIDLPEGLEKGEAFGVTVRQVTSRPHRLVRLESDDDGPPTGSRHIVGSFQLTIPVRDKATILPHEQRLLSTLRWIRGAIPSKDRWSGVFGRYVAQVADRVDALGGDARRVAPSPSGEWQSAYRWCMGLSLITAVLLAVALTTAGGPVGGWGAGIAALAVALLAASVGVWRRRCRPTVCQVLRSLLAGAAVGSIVLILIGLLDAWTARLLTVLIVALIACLVIAIEMWRRGCWPRR